jgi:hypothetical protein
MNEGVAWEGGATRGEREKRALEAREGLEVAYFLGFGGAAKEFC